MTEEELSEFARLAAEAKRQAWTVALEPAQLLDLIAEVRRLQAGVEAEREACAKMAEEFGWVEGEGTDWRPFAEVLRGRRRP